MSFPLTRQANYSSLVTCFKKGAHYNCWSFRSLIFAAKRYWGDRDQTDLVMRKDEKGILWMHTGDQVTLDSDGYLRGELLIPLPANTWC